MQTSKNYTHIIWDWNGTLLDDVRWCIMVMNEMLSKRGLKIIDGIPEYHRVFGFPVKNYYRNVGFDFDKDPFELLAVEYLSVYHSERSSRYCGLHKNTAIALKTLYDRKKTQVILSASETNNLLMQVGSFNIKHFFDEIIGLSSIHAESKIEAGRNYLDRKAAEKTHTVLIGDTVHDFEVAKELGIDCFLIANGHQSREKLRSFDVPVFDDILSVVDFVP